MEKVKFTYSGALEMISLNLVKDFGIDCTVIMPIYNRLEFLDQAVRSLQLQTYKSWRLIVVDDGSSDQSQSKLQELAQEISNPIYYLYQENSGPGMARNNGVKHSPECKFFAFFDSDDEWLEDYLSTAINALNINSELDWVFMACQRVDYKSKRVLLESTFNKPDGNRVEFFDLKLIQRNSVYIFSDNQQVILEHIVRPLNAGFQNSVIKAAVLQTCEIPRFRIGEDRYFFSTAVIAKHTIGFIDRVGVIYNVHEDNISNTNNEIDDYEKTIKVYSQLLESYRSLSLIADSIQLKLAIRKEISVILFWNIAYNCLVPTAHFGEALRYMFRGFVYWPFKTRYLKTICATALKILLGKH